MIGAGIIGRFVLHDVTRGEGADQKKTQEPCEVVACQASGEYGTWKILLSTSGGYLIETGPSRCRIIAEPKIGDGPYR